MELEGCAHTWRFPRQAAQGITNVVTLRALHRLHFLGPHGADSVHPSRRGGRLGGRGPCGEWIHLYVQLHVVLTCLGEEDHQLGYHAGPRSQHTRSPALAPSL